LARKEKSLKALLGTKLGMLQITKDNGVVVPVTLIQAGPCIVTQVKTDETDGYQAVQLGFTDDEKQGKSRTGHLKKANSKAKIIKEFRTEENDLKVGDKIDVSIFELGDKVKVSAKSKGKGFAGTVKRHNFNTGPKSHGSKNVRRPGSIGSMYPQNVYKGRKMAGQMGGKRTTTNNLKVEFLDKEKNLIGLLGAVPGPNKVIVEIRG